MSESENSAICIGSRSPCKTIMGPSILSQILNFRKVQLIFERFSLCHLEHPLWFSRPSRLWSWAYCIPNRVSNLKQYQFRPFWLRSPQTIAQFVSHQIKVSIRRLVLKIKNSYFKKILDLRDGSSSIIEIKFRFTFNDCHFYNCTFVQWNELCFWSQN